MINATRKDKRRLGRMSLSVMVLSEAEPDQVNSLFSCELCHFSISNPSPVISN